MYSRLAFYLHEPLDTEETKFVGGLVGDGIGGGVDSIKESILELADWIVDGLFNITSPFIEWGCKISIVGLLIAYYLSEDKKCIVHIIKIFLVFYIFFMIKEALV